MLNKDEENNEKLKEYKKLLEGLESLFNEFQNINKQPVKKKVEKKISAKKEVKISLNIHESYKELLQSEHHKGKLTLLDEKQALDENESYQKIIDLLLEENDTIPAIETENGDPDKYLLTQIFTTFSLLERKIYFSGDKPLEEKKRDFLKNLNRIKFNKDSKLTPEMLSYFNNNILRIEDIFQSKENKINVNNPDEKKLNEEKIDKKIYNIEAKEIKKQLDLDKNINVFDSFNDNTNVILNDEIKDEGVQQIESISYEKKFENIDLNNEEYKKIKSTNMRKILEIENDKLKNVTNEEFQEIIKEVYSNGEITNKELENKITGGKSKLFIDENDIKITDNENITFPNDIEISINPEEKMENEEIVDDKDIPDFDQDEIKTQQNKTSFFEKEDFEKEFFPNLSEQKKENNTFNEE